MRSTVLLFTDIKETLDMLTDEQAGQIFKAIIDYQTGNEVALDGLLNVIFAQIKRQIDYNNEKYDNDRKKRSEAGKKGMQNRWHKDNTDNNVITKDNNLTDDITNDNGVINVKENDNKHNITVTDTDTVTKTNKDNKGRFTPPTLEEVQAYCNERGNKVDPARFIDFYESKGWMIGKNKMKDWKASVRTWEMRNKQETKPNAFTEYQQNQYDYDELERRLTANVKSG